MAINRCLGLTLGGFIMIAQGAIAEVSPQTKQLNVSQIHEPSPSLPSQTIAQIMPDSTTGSMVTPDQIVRDKMADLIQGGIKSGSNLFHSFSEFNISDTQNVYFANPTGIDNILTRVTGVHRSNIFGTLGVDGNANLFLINPNGIYFGENARLDINGSFTASTADGIMLGESGYFSATDLQNSQFLNVQPGALFKSPIRNYTVSINNEGNLEIGAGETLTLQSDIVNHSGALITQGGTVQILGDRLNLTGNALVDVSAPKGNGGTVLIGGDFQGKGDIYTAQNTSIGNAVQILANAGDMGDGGKVIIWADQHTLFAGNIEAKGGNFAGNGGFVEVSGKDNLLFLGNVKTTAFNGKTGQLLLDPDNIVIVQGAIGDELGDLELVDAEILESDGGSIDYTITNGKINDLLKTTNVSLAATQNITQNADISAATNLNESITLTYQAGENININADITVDTTGNASNLGRKLNVVFDAGNRITIGDGTGDNEAINLNGGSLTMNASEIDFLGGNITSRENGGGTLAIASKNNNINFGGTIDTVGHLNLKESELAEINDGFSQITIDAGTNEIFLGTATVNDATQLIAEKITSSTTEDTTFSLTENVGETAISDGRITFANGGTLIANIPTIIGGSTNDSLQGTDQDDVVEITGNGNELLSNGVTFQNIQNFDGLDQVAGDSILGTNNVETVAIASDDSFTINSDGIDLDITFKNVEKIETLDGEDKFNIAGVATAIKLDGGVDSDTVTYLGSLNNTINLEDFFNIETINAGNGTDTLQGSNTSNENFILQGSKSVIVNDINILNIENIIAGTSSEDRITGSNVANEIFTLTNTNGVVNVSGINFTQIEKIDAGTSPNDVIIGTAENETFTLNGVIGEVRVRAMDFTGVETVDAGGETTGDRLIGGNTTNENFEITGTKTLLETTSQIAFADLEIVNAGENGTLDNDTVTGTSGNNNFEITGNETLTNSGINFTQIETLDTSSGSDTVNFTASNSQIPNIISSGSQLNLSGTVGGNLTAETTGILNVTNLTTDGTNTDEINLSGTSLNVTNSTLSALNTIDLNTTGGNLQLTGNFLETTTNDLRDNGGDIRISTCNSLSSACTGSIIVRDSLTNPLITKASGDLFFTGEIINISILNPDSNLQSGSLTDTTGDLNLLAYKTVSITDTVFVPFNFANVDGDLLIQSGVNRTNADDPSDPPVEQQGILLFSNSFLNDFNNEEFIYQVTGSAILRTDGTINVSNVDLNSGEFAAEKLDGSTADISSDTGVVISAVGNVKFGNYTGLSLKVEAGGSIFVLGDILITGAASPFDVISGYDSAEALGSSVLTFLDGNTTSLQAANLNNDFPSLAVTTLESALGLPSGILSNASFTGIAAMATEGSAVKLTYTLGAGESLSIPINQNFFSYESLPFNDFAFISVVKGNGEVSLTPIASVANAGANLQTILLDNSGSGTTDTFTVGIGVVDVLDTLGFSTLNVTAASAFDPDFGILSASPSVILRAGVDPANIQNTPYDLAPTITKGGALFEPTAGGALPTGSISLQGKVNTSGDENTGGSFGGNVILSATGEIEIATNLGGSGTTLGAGDTLIRTAAASNSNANAGNIDITAGGKITIGSGTNQYDLDLSASGNGQAGSLRIVANGGGVTLRNLDIFTNVMSLADGDTGIGGNVEIAGSSVTLNRTNIDAASFASDGQSGTVRITADPTGAVTLTSDASATDQSTIFTDTFARTGDRQTGGDILLRGGAINLDNYRLNAQVTSGLGDGGDISIVATGAGTAAPIPSNGESLASGEVRIQDSSKILTSVTENAAGRGGDITIQGEQVTIQNQGTLISADTASAETSGTGGIITVSGNEQIRLSDGAKISAQTAGAARGGDIFLGKVTTTTPPIKTATNTITIDNASISSSSLGTAVDAVGGTAQLAAKNITLINSEITAFSTGIADSGRIILGGGFNDLGEQNYADQISLQAGSEVSVSAFSEGSSQSIELFTNDLQVLAGSRILAETNSSLANAGAAGDITIKADPNRAITHFLISGTDALGGSSTISTATKGGLGGDITIEAESGKLELGDRGLITAATSGTSRGGDIALKAQTLNLTTGGRILATSSSSATAGAIAINADSVLIQGIANAQTFADQINPELGFSIIGNVQPFGSGVLISNGFGSKTVNLLNSDPNFLDNIPVNIAGTKPTEGSQFQLLIDPLLVGIDPTITDDITFSFDLTFTTTESNGSSNSFNDFAYLLASNIAAAIGLSPAQISDLQASEAIEVFDTNGGTNQTQTFTFTLNNIGSSNLNLGVVDVADTAFDSSVFISNYKINDIPLDLVTENVLAAQTSGIFAEAIAGGSAGTIAITTTQLNLHQGGEIAVNATGDGAAGAITIEAPEVNLGREAVISGGKIAAATENGSGGSITFKNTASLGVVNGLVTSSTASGVAGDLTVGTGDKPVSTVTLQGQFIDPVSGLAQTGGFTAAATAGGSAGSIALFAEELTVNTGAAIAVSATQAGTAGDIGITAKAVTLQGGEISAETEAGGADNPANITLTGLENLEITNGLISSSTKTGVAGDVTIDATNAVTLAGALTDQEGGIQAAATEGGNAGSITVTTEQLTVKTGAAITVSAGGTGTAGDIAVTAMAVDLDGGRINATTEAGGSETEKANITLAKLTTLAVQNGGSINSSTVLGQAGDIVVTALGQLTDPVDGIITVAGENAAITSSASEGGKAGSVTLTSDQLNVKDQGAIAVGAGGTGTAGDIEIIATKVQVLGGEISAETEAGGASNPANITLTGLENLEITNGLISSSTQTGVAGDVTINAAQTVNLSGQWNNQEGGIQAAATEGGDAGSVAVTTAQLQVNTGAAIAVSSDNGDGFAGNIDLTAATVKVIGGRISAETDAGGAGNPANITFTGLEQLDITNGLISSSTQTGVAGDITVGTEGQPVLELTLAGNFTDPVRQTIQTGGLAAEATAGGTAGSIAVLTDKLTVNTGAAIAVSAAGAGTAGDIAITASAVKVLGGQISAETEAGGANNPANITLTGLNSLDITNGLISSSTQTGKAGDITVDTANAITLSGQFQGQTGGIQAEATDGDAGSVNVTASALKINTGAAIAVSAGGTGTAGNLEINVPEVNLDGGQIAASTEAGSGGSITFQNLTNLAVNGGLVTSSTASGTAGAIQVNAAKDALTNAPVLVITLANPFSPSQKGGLLAEASTNGQAGAITVEAKQLTIHQGAAIAVNAAGTGTAGAIAIDAPRINLNGGEIAAKTAAGSGGAITLDTLQLTIQNAGEINSSTEGGRAGNILINIPNQQEGSLILDGQGSQITASTTGINSDGIGGNIVIREPWEMIIRNGAQIATDSEGRGKGGDIDLAANNLVLQNQARISSRTQTSDGGNISITINDISNLNPLDNFSNVTNAIKTFNQNFNNNFDYSYLKIINALWLSGGSNISSTAGSAVSGGNGGNINIITPWAIAAPKQDSNITANAFFGNGGKINVTTNYLFGIGFTDEDIPVRNDITASSQFGSDGIVLISTLGVDPTSGLIELPEELVDADSLIGNNACALEGGKIAGGSSLVIKGKGGLPVNPNESLNTIDGLIGFIPLPEHSRTLSATHDSTTDQTFSNIHSHPITIAQAHSWKLLNTGKVVLTPDSNPVLAQPVAFQHPDCGNQQNNS